MEAEITYCAGTALHLGYINLTQHLMIKVKVFDEYYSCALDSVQTQVLLYWAISENT